MEDPFAGALDMTAAVGFSESTAPPKLPHRIALIDGDMQLYAAAYHAQDNTFEDGVAHLRRRHAEVMEMTGATSARTYMTGPGNYRFDVAVTAPYKGNRADRVKPDWFDDLREYMLEEAGAIECLGNEADDALATTQHLYNSLAPLADIRDAYTTTEHTIICTGDKDLNAVAGWHYNIHTGRTFWADPFGAIRLIEKKSGKKLDGEGLLFFFSQLLTGDSTDNIPGAPAPTAELAKEFGFRKAKGIGPVAAHAMLAECPPTMDGLREAYRRCERAYGISEEAPDKSRLIEMGRLLWMQHWPKEMWSPSHIGRLIGDLDLNGYIYMESETGEE